MDSLYNEAPRFVTLYFEEEGARNSLYSTIGQIDWVSTRIRETKYPSFYARFRE